MHRTLAQVPQCFRKYIASQDYSRYTAIDQAGWRFIMKHSVAEFQSTAVASYRDGLRKTGISIDNIPRIETMNEKLREFGWGAVAVRGFIPPAAFIALQSNRILPIAVDMRTTNHIAYTPAPDIVHEAAGHAPIIADPEYADYLQRYGKVANHAIFSNEDVRLYEAIRQLSDVKENPDMTPDDIKRASKDLDEAVANISFVSEASQVARMYWWTAEYGLVGDLDNPKIYGAGLLSSVGESSMCLSPKVKKIPLSLDCIHTTYDITEPQPQLFVARDYKHLVAVLEELEATLSFKIGGKYGMEKAIESNYYCTVTLGNGLQLSGIVAEIQSAQDSVSFYRFSSPVQLSFGGSEINGHGKARHPHGFSSPVGKWKDYPSLDLDNLNPNALADLGIRINSDLIFSYESGITVKGKLIGLTKASDCIQGRSGDDRVLLMTFAECTVSQGDQILFDPAWGEFDLAIGASIPSVSGGVADPDNYGDLDIGESSTSPSRSSAYTDHEVALIAEYQKVKDWREKHLPEGNLEKIEQSDVDAIVAVMQGIIERFPEEWLLHLECSEILQTILKKQKDTKMNLLQQLLDSFESSIKKSADAKDPVLKNLILKGQSLYIN